MRLVGVSKLTPITPNGEISEIATKTIKYATFYNFTIYELNEAVLNLLKKLVEICGDKIKCDFVLTWTSRNYEEWAKVLIEYVTAHEVLMKIDEKDSNKFLATPIHLPVPPHEIQVNLYKNYSLKNLLHFIGGGDLFMPNRYQLDFYEIVCEESEQRAFCKNLLQLYQHENPEKLVLYLHCHEGDAYPSFFHQELRRLLEDQKISCEKVRTEVRSSYYDIYEYHRSDGWCLKILFNYYSKTNDRYVSFTFILNNGCADVDRVRGYLD
uniref:Uncharacterized protein n=1 Tax=Acrobeloides nanus TaxID=290746 RepID=A0A914E1T7_9BILA